MKAMKVVLSSGVFLLFVGIFVPWASAAHPSTHNQDPLSVTQEDGCADIQDQEACLHSPGCTWDDENQRCVEFAP
ncbi:MAG: hypothetical protein QM820_05980 [Minicystis sp.]